MKSNLAEAAEQGMNVQLLTGNFGCEISGVDVTNLSEEQFATIYQLFVDYSVVVFRDLELTKEQFAEFGKRFAPLEDEPFLPYKTDVDGIYYFKGAGSNNKKLTTQNLGWHVDHSYQENPSGGAMLYALSVPASGGDTVFASNALSYNGLSDAMQEFLADKKAVHDVLHYSMSSGLRSMDTPEGLEGLKKRRENFPPTIHPLVCTHPESGKKMLYLNEMWTTAICGMRPKESAAILGMLREHAIDALYQCRVRWFNKSLLLWDNRAVQHRPTSDYDGERSMLRLALHSDWRPGE